MEKNKTLNIETKINLLINLNNAMIISKKKIYDLSYFEKEFVKSSEKDIYYHSFLYLTLTKEKTLLNKCDMELEDSIIEQLKAINIRLRRAWVAYNSEKRFNEGVRIIMEKDIEIIEIKDFSNSGVYYVDKKGSRKLVSADGTVSGNLYVFEKINILNSITDSMLSESFDESKKDAYDKIFSKVFDINNMSLERDVNALYSNLMNTYYRPVRYMKKIENIKNSLVKCTFIEENSDSKVKYLINERVCYM